MVEAVLGEAVVVVNSTINLLKTMVLFEFLLRYQEIIFVFKSQLKIHVINIRNVSITK